ncbi:hypothetical protein COW36_09985 [bacterium (Candidatus Blackallbacteria) CG17_big_fil_post_rev_8_21_14_2_50_48_46]|uniref:4-vinyl reductase 4VR domain-containing protein n=1 Tax=bacterium (Candidatus Blackallbacteria) CG17_big_fil_post_rev_8_21_14_2_50_48_46 TaxID=2014261 RepID=A0A2M7G5M4_9BACT|nr:MAG: hypothetical protein COW64_13905 [bacterium (Candidatus Blackallbacteria) CG18_big_fil_WC_8_21_14_2_50_49_26]PIW17128.1 MAG: hypothetical protein COW36_09985 [bacterium (Candidatus Blackallbacteria) CG17_big_fil_post_rev_8_21_14_2_50_48_46]PIW47822.1 MAG: hypothetical protein COW20_11215 [bacterium (Candidatus Blackallbacteria) CG13_big_fil_rev_8_21_14_2_50_49_14]
MSIQVDFQSAKGLVNVYGQSMLFHCNHYNRYLQQTIEDPDYIDSEKILLQSAAETVYLQLKACFAQNPDWKLADKLAMASEIFQFAGFGILDFSKFADSGHSVTVPSSHFGLAMKLNVGHRTKAAEYFDKGFIAGVVEALKDELGPEFQKGFTLTQSQSISLGDDYCRYVVKAGESPAFDWLEKLVPAELPAFCEIPERKFTETPVDEAGIVQAVSGLPLVGDEEGLIPAFGLYLTRMYADYYNKTSFRFEEELQKQMGSVELATELLVESGHICAFNTFGGIMKSAEWKALIQPHLQEKADWVHGMVAVTNALGWGIWRVEELVPGEKLVMRIYEDYESLGYLRWFGKADHPISYLATGGCAGLMNLIYYGDITTDPVLDKELYVKLFQEGAYFVGKQTKCLAMGDEYTEIVVVRNQ